MVPQARLTGVDPDNVAATNRLREEVSGSSWGWDLKLRKDIVSGGRAEPWRIDLKARLAASPLRNVCLWGIYGGLREVPVGCGARD